MELTSYQAWLTGFITGVISCLTSSNIKLTIDEFKQQLADGKLDDLIVVQNVGRDDPNGVWTMAGARMGTYLVMCTQWDHTLFNNQDTIDELWQSVEAKGDEMLFGSVAEQLAELGLPMINMDAATSKFFKYFLDAKLNPTQS